MKVRMVMKVRILLSFFSALLFLVGLSFGTSLAQTQTSPTLTSEASRMDSLAASQGGNKVIDKLSTEFSSFLGTDSKAVVVGLRNGTPINLTTTTTSPTPGGLPTNTTTTTITPPTGKMGFGNVFISLALAKQELSQVGITQPTPSQLQAALTGGTITTGTGLTSTSTTLQGILTLRSEGMGWGQIAHRLNMNLGKVVSGLKASNNAMAATTSSSSTGSGVVTGSGKALGKSGKGAETGEGIVTGSGRPTGSEGGITTGRGNAYGVSGGSSGGGGQAKGHSN